MTITTVMGTALTGAVKLAEEHQVLSSVRAELVDRFNEVGPWLPVPGNPRVASLDWVHLISESVRSIQATADLASPSPRQLEDGLASYCTNNDLKVEWKAGVRDILGVRTVSGAA